MYEDLFKRYKDQNPKAVFAHFGYKAELGENWETPFHKLAEKAKPESWNFEKTEFKKEGINYPILSSYLNFCSGQLIPDTKLSFFSAMAGGSPPLNWCGRIQL